MCSNHFLSHDGCEWLKGYLDPFHDYELRNEGYPDEFQDASVVYRVRKQVTITKPVGLPAGPWDAHVYWTPLTSSVGLARQCDFDTSADLTAGELGLGGTAVPFGGLMIDSVTSGGRTVEVGAVERRQILLDDILAGSSDKYSRIVSGGFEVANTTADIYKQGTVTCYCAPVFKQDVEYVGYNTATGIATRTGRAKLMSMPPATVDQAQLYNGTRVWEAEEGAYVPFRFVSAECPPSTYESTPFIMTSVTPGAPAQPDIASSDLITVVLPGTTNVSTTNCSIGPSKFNNMHNQGAYFTGLSDQTTLTVILHADLEVFPAADSTLISLATPSCKPDPKAIQLAASVQGELPVATMRRDNDAGDWFRKILKVVRTVSGYVQYAPGPVGTVANITHDGTGAALKMMGLSKSERKKAAVDAAKAATQAVLARKSIPAVQTKKK